jgi:hypothetical protein
MSSRVLDIIKEVINEGLLKEGVQGVLVSIKGHDRKIPFYDTVGKDSIWSRLRIRAVDPNGRPEAIEIADALTKAGFDVKSKAGDWKRSDIISISDPVDFADTKEAKAWKEEQGRSAGKKKETLNALSKLPVYKIKDEDFKEYSTTYKVGDLGDPFKKGPIKPMAGDDIAKQDQGLGKNYKDADAPKRDSDYVSVSKDTRDRNTTTGRDPKDAKWIKGINEDDSDVTDDEKKALSADRGIKSGIDKVPGDVDTDDVTKDDSAAEAGKKESKKDFKYLKVSSFKKYAALYPELNNPNQKIIEKSPTKIGDDKNQEAYYKILDPKRFTTVSNDYQLRPIADPYESGSPEAKLRRDLEGATPEEKRAIMAKYKGKDVPSKSSVEKKSNPAKGPEFKAPVGKSGKPMVSKGKRDVQVRESIFSIIKQVIKEETSK